MIWNTDTHHLVATVCRRTGRPCPAACLLAEKLAQAMLVAAPVTSGDFEISGRADLEHCGAPCPARFRAGHGRVRVFCGAGAEASDDRLDRFADAMLGTGNDGFAADGCPVPCAIVEAAPARAAPGPAPVVRYA